MTTAISSSEIAQSLLREIGVDRVQAYLAQRLDAGIGLQSRTLLIRAYAKLAGQAAFPLLETIMTNPAEQEDSRYAAVQSIAEVLAADRSNSRVSRSLSILYPALGDESEMVRSAAAVALAQTGSKSVTAQLAELVGKQQLDSFAEYEVRSFLERIDFTDSLGRWSGSFVGREEELLKMAQLLAEPTSIVAVQGIGGIGKTAFVQQFIRYFAKTRYGKLHSLSGRSMSSDELETSLEHITRQATETHQKRPDLIVIDDFEAVKDRERFASQLSSFVSQYPNLRCILISRLDIERYIPKAATITLSPLSNAEVSEYVRRRSGLEYEPTALRPLITMAGGVPLFLALLLEMSPATGIGFSQKGQMRYMDSAIERTLELLPGSQRQMLEILAQFESSPIDWRDSMVTRLFDNENTSRPEEQLERLAEWGLIQMDRTLYLIEIHSLIRDYLRRRTDRRTTLRVNKTLASHYEKNENPLLAARQWINAGEPRQAEILLHFVLNEATRTGNTSELGEAAAVLERLEASVGAPKAAGEQNTPTSDALEPSSLRARLDKLTAFR